MVLFVQVVDYSSRINVTKSPMILVSMHLCFVLLMMRLMFGWQMNYYRMDNIHGLITQQGDYQWIAGCSSTYTNWYPGEPNNLGVGDCVVMTFNGRWDSLPDSAYSYTICSCEY